MSMIPRLPEEFFQVWLPSAFSGVAAPGPGAAGADSPGALTFWVGEQEPYTLRLRAGALHIERSLPVDCIVQVVLSEADFEPVLVRGAEALMSHGTDRQLSVLRALSLEPERIEMIRSVPGSVAFILKADTAEHRVVLTPGNRSKSSGNAECTVRCALQDFLAMQRGEANPFELMMNARLQISGDAQIPMALSSLLM